MTTGYRTRIPPPLGSHAWLRWFRQTKRWRDLSARVRREEPTCWLRLPGCTGASDTADHIIPAAIRPHLAYERSNLRGACHNCNSRRKDKHPHARSLRTIPGRRRPTTSQALKPIATPTQLPPALEFFNTQLSNNNGASPPDNGNISGAVMRWHRIPHPQTMARNNQTIAKCGADHDTRDYSVEQR